MNDISRHEQIVKRLLPRGWRLAVRRRDTAEASQRWAARARPSRRLQAEAAGFGQTREEALENLEGILALLALHESMSPLGWRLVETYDPIDFPDELTFPVVLENGPVGIVVDVGQGRRDLDLQKSRFSDMYPGAAVVVVPPNAVSDPVSLRRAVEDVLSLRQAPVDPTDPR